MKSLPLWTPLASLSLALAWLAPNASPPWSSFHKDAWTACVLSLVGLAFVAKRARNSCHFSLDPISAGLLILAVWCWGQWYFGKIHFSGHAVLGFSYLFAACLAVIVGKAWEGCESHALGDFLYLALLVASLSTTGFMLFQWLGIVGNDVWLNELSTAGRPYGNLQQPNNAATLLLLGMCSLLWFHGRRRLRSVVGLGGALWLLFFVVLTGSRIGYLSFLSLALIVCVLSFRHTEMRGVRFALVVLCLAMPLFVLSITHDWGGVQGGAAVAGPRLTERPLTSLRLQIYEAHLEATLARPWWGGGFGQGAKAQLSAAELGYPLPGLTTWAHNVFLDIAGWFGLPAMLALLCALALVLRALLNSAFSLARMGYFAGVYAVFMHAMVELPHGYAYFLLPASLLAGAMMSGLKLQSVCLPRSGVMAALIGMFGLLMVIGQDYLRIESAFYTWRFKQANVGRTHAMDIPDVRVLNQFHALLVGLRGSASSLDDEAVQEFGQAVLLFPSAAALQHLTEVKLKRGDLDGARQTIAIARALTDSRERRAMAARWVYLGTQDQDFNAVEWPE